MIRRLKQFAQDHFEIAVILLVLLGLLLLALVVQNKFSFLNYFFLPVILCGYFLGKRIAVLTAVFCVLAVILYLAYIELISGAKVFFFFHEVINLVTWSGFLILTGALIGSFSEQREAKLLKLRNAYVGTLEIMLKYLESADEATPPALRVARLSGRIAAAAGLDTREIENIKSASLLSLGGDLSSSLPLFVEMTEFMGSDEFEPGKAMGDREKVMLRSTSSLLKAIEPLLQAFYEHYVQHGDSLDKDLGAIPLGSGIIALAQVYDKISTQSPPHQGREEFRTMSEVQKLAGRTFHTEAIEALMLVVGSP
jgi:HD-GYP domain-containing protein (c-di-GMP phosphodiesterase class II)